MTNWTNVGPVGSLAGSVINNGGTATIAAGDNATDGTPNGSIYIGGSIAQIGGSGGNGYVVMSGGTLNGSPYCGRVPGTLGVASGSGIFTQTGGTNNSIVNSGYGYTGDFSSVSLGFSPGGYGEYNLQGGA